MERHVSYIPKTLKRGVMLVHNHVRPKDFHPMYPLGAHGVSRLDHRQGTRKAADVQMRMGAAPYQAFPREPDLTNTTTVKGTTNAQA
jgi:hypothetical protein